MAAGLNDAALVEGKGAEGACAKAAAVAHQAELHLFDCRHTPRLFIAGVVGAAVRKFVNFVHLLRGEGLLGRILHNELIAAGLCQPLGGEGIAVIVLAPEAFRVLLLIFF